MKTDLIEIANIPYRNAKAKQYSDKINRSRKLKGAIISILIGIVAGLFFGFCHIKSVAMQDGAEIWNPKVVEMTYYLPTGNNCANTKPPHEGIVAFAPEYIGDTAILYEYKNGKVGNMIGIYEIYDTGYGKTLPSGYGSIESGETVDVFFENDADGKEFIREHGNQVYMQVVKAVG